MATILIIGSTGTVGAHLSQQLVQQGHQVRGATRSAEHPVEGVEPVQLDLTGPETFAAALAGVQRLFVLAPGGHADSYSFLKPFLTAAVASETLERVVLMTALGVEHDDTIPLRRLELLLQASDLPTVVLRPTWFSQNFHTFWGHGVREFNTLALPAADARVAFIDARDIAASAAAALTRDDLTGDSAWELTGPEALTHAEAAAVLADVTGAPISYSPIDDDAFRAQLAPSGLSDDYIELLVALFGAVRMGVADTVTDHVERLTGAAPRSVRDYAVDHKALLTR